MDYFDPYKSGGPVPTIRARTVVGGLGLKIKVIEKTGPKVKQLLHRSSIGINSSCPRGCIVCSDGENRISCLTSDVTYRIKCPECGLIQLLTAYDGETTRMAKTRAEEHWEKLKKRDKKSTLWTHARDCHGGIVPKYNFEITGTFLKRPLHRQLMEAIHIDSEEVDVRLNSKNEWHTPMSIAISQERGSNNIIL